MTAANLASPLAESRATATAVVRSARVPLVAAVLVRAALVGVVAAAIALLGVALADVAAPLSLAARLIMRRVAVAAGVATATAFLLRDRGVLSLPRVAMWLEERLPQLDFALVTQLELESRGLPMHGETRWPGWRGVVFARAGRAIAIPLVVALIALGMASMVPAGSLARARSPRAGDAIERSPNVAPGASRLAPLIATVQPPAYSGLARSELDEPATISALAGADVTLEGRGEPTGLAATLAATALAVTGQGGDRWSVRLRMPLKPAVVRLRDRTFERLVVLEPRVDAPPTVVLTRPDRDSVLRTPSGTVPLAAHATDDLRLGDATFEIILSSGEGETFTFRTLMLGAVRPTGDSVLLAASLTLDTLRLKPGDLLHIRAVARDRNDVTGPGVGASETRTLRIARQGEYDSVAVESASPPPEEQNVVSQRMLIMLTEALERRRPKLSRATVLDESSRISTDQKRLRRSVAEVIFSRLGEPTGEETKEDEAHDKLTPDELLKRADEATERLSGTGTLDFEGGETPVVAVNRPLLEAYRAMWDASMSLDQGEPAKALPPMRRALAAIERARQAERIYLRGRPPAAVVDIEKVRLAARESVTPGVRSPRLAIDSVRASLGDRFTRALDVLATRPLAAIDSLMLLRIDALESAPRFAAAVGDLATALRAGHGNDAPRLTALARRALGGAAKVTDAPGAWTLTP